MKRETLLSSRYMPKDNAAFSVLWEHLPLLLLLLLITIMIIGLSLASPFFLTWSNWRNILDHSALQVILAVGMTFVIASGGIDLSVGSVAALSGVVMAAAMHGGLDPGLAIVCGLGAGAACGAANGTLIALLKTNPFIITLGAMSVARGLALIITGGIPIYGFSRSFTWWGSGHVGVLNPPILMALVLILAGAVLLNLSRFGYYTVALGGNEEALRRSGVHTTYYKIMVYTGCGLTAALAGLVLTARLNTAEPLAGWMFELDSIAAVVLGGTSMKGGRGTIAGTMLACLLLGLVRNGLVILSIPSYYQQLISGLIIILAVAFSELRGRSGKEVA